MNDILVRAATTPELTAAASALADAFADDPSFGFIPADQRARRVRAYMSEAVTHGWLVEVALDGDRVLGAGLWEPPDRPSPSVLTSARHALGHVRPWTPRFVGARIDRRLAAIVPRSPTGSSATSAWPRRRRAGAWDGRFSNTGWPTSTHRSTSRGHRPRGCALPAAGLPRPWRFSGRHMPAVGMWRRAP